MDHIIRQRLHELYDWLQICKEMCELYGYDVNEIAKDEIIKRKEKSVISINKKTKNQKDILCMIMELTGILNYFNFQKKSLQGKQRMNGFNIINIWNMFLLHLIAQDRDLRVGTSLLKETEDGGLTIAFRLMCERREI